MDEASLLDRIARGLREPLPGIPAQLSMAVDPRPGHKPYYEVEETCRKAGVLVLLYRRDGRLYVLLTLRTDRVLHHRGQVSFPGGEQHPGESIEATALRETEEEIGLDLSAVRILGRLTPLYVPPSNYCVYPTVAFFPSDPEFHPQPDEVAEVIEVPLADLADPASVRRESWDLGGRRADVPYFAAAGHRIWGATAMILSEFVALLGASR